MVYKGYFQNSEIHFLSENICMENGVILVKHARNTSENNYRIPQTIPLKNLSLDNKDREKIIGMFEGKKIKKQKAKARKSLQAV